MNVDERKSKAFTNDLRTFKFENYLHVSVYNFRELQAPSLMIDSPLFDLTY